ncbi:hypothetical protein CC78DRAFT_518311 [Lojkania enalia]|uniref:Methyltransferase-domain-containing protein n=1 Tax=Lojkania enalia TaxID=147567 RepID=A0A9P4K7R0_9PLEO|nr:hypothetical protein CC78DRAFT_518311 [Didymosphaeria enalia]
MRYIRFLKTPRIVEEKNPSKAHVYCLITIASDLGDSFLPHDVNLSAELRSDDEDGKVYVRKVIQWSAGMRDLPILLPFGRSKITWPTRVRVGIEPGAAADDFKKLYESKTYGIVSAWSAPLDPAKGSKEALKLVQRRIGISKESQLRIWEETGESIARHLWDAGIVLSCHLNDLVDGQAKGKALAEFLLPPKGKKRLQVLELGTGCGIVGICLAQRIGNADVILSDLPEAQEIVKRNLQKAKLAKGSKLSFQELDWEEELPDGLRSWSKCPHCTQVDLVVAADCTYNQDSSPALVATLGRLAKTSPGVSVIIAMKERHSDEKVFFDLMSDASFITADSISLPLPGDEEPGEETVEIYLFQFIGKTRLPEAVSNDFCCG